MHPKNKPLLNILNSYNEKNILPMHMPGHKRNHNLLTNEINWSLDFTEINGLDDLHQANGMLLESMNNAAALWGSKEAFFLVNGSTSGILAGIRTLTKRNDKVLLARNCHKSVLHAIELCGLVPVFLPCSINNRFEICDSVKPSDVEEFLNNQPDIKLVIITSPSYEGVISDIKSITDIAHKKNVPVLVDEAHGAHLDLSPYFTGGAVKAGADIVVQSLHKTLPSLTQTAILHINGDFVNTYTLKHQLAVFQTSSPSYVLMSSADYCVRLLQKNKQELFKNLHDNLYFLEGEFKKSNIDILGFDKDSFKDNSNIFSYDKSKILLSVKNISYNGSQFLQFMLNNYKIQFEMAMGKSVLGITSVCDTQSDFIYLSNSLKSAFNNMKINDNICKLKSTPLPLFSSQSMLIDEALTASKEVVSLNKSTGRVSGEYVWAYPPGIPIIIPGQLITTETISSIILYKEQDIKLNSTFNCLPKEICVVK